VLAACEWIFAGAPLPEVLKRLAGAGRAGIELSGEPGRPDRAGLAAELAAADMQATGITAICPAPTDERDLSHGDPAARRRAGSYYRGCVGLACEVGAPVVGLIPAPIGCVDGMAEDAWSSAVDAARAVGGPRSSPIENDPVTDSERYRERREPSLAAGEGRGRSRPRDLVLR
jgi:sugar phosphate isomerase/epimerase